MWLSELLEFQLQLHGSKRRRGDNANQIASLGVSVWGIARDAVKKFRGGRN